MPKSFILLIFALLPGCEFSVRGLDSGAADLSLGTPFDFADTADIADIAMVDFGPSPTVIYTNPVSDAINVSVGKKPTATFDLPMDPSTITTLTFTLTQGATPVSGTVAVNATGDAATFTPDAPLGISLLYTATITTGAKDTGQAPLMADYVWSFRMGACSQAPVNLRSAASFAVLASTTITNTGATTTVTGDLGLYAGTAVTGAPMVIGTKHVTDAIAMQGMADLAKAYSDAAGRTLCPTMLSGDIGGKVLMPGLYQASAPAITAADLTLDAQGDSDAVFIFQVGTSLTTAASRKVILANGAKAANIYWQIGTAPSFAMASVFKGNLLAHDAISLGDGATLDQGRAMSLTAAVNLYNSTIVKPAP